MITNLVVELSDEGLTFYFKRRPNGTVHLEAIDAPSYSTEKLQELYEAWRIFSGCRVPSPS
jgi:hypothetical protein